MHKRTGIEPRSLPLVVATAAYIDLLSRLRPQVHSALKRLYAMNTTAINMVDLELNEVEDALNQMETLRVSSYVDQSYLVFAIKQNICSYIETLKALIKARLDYMANMHEVHDDWVNTDRKRRSFYNPTPATAKMLERLVDDTSYFTSVANAAVVNTIGPIAEAITSESNRVIGMDGRIYESPRCDEVIQLFLDNTDRILKGPVDMCYTVKHLPVLKIYLSIARLVSGSVDVDEEQRQIPLPASLRNGVMISDSTLAAMPAPRPEILPLFAEPEVGYLSGKGQRYISALDVYYRNPASW